MKNSKSECLFRFYFIFINKFFEKIIDGVRFYSFSPQPSTSLSRDLQSLNPCVHIWVRTLKRPSCVTNLLHNVKKQFCFLHNIWKLIKQIFVFLFLFPRWCPRWSTGPWSTLASPTWSTRTPSTPDRTDTPENLSKEAEADFELWPLNCKRTSSIRRNVIGRIERKTKNGRMGNSLWVWGGLLYRKRVRKFNYVWSEDFKLLIVDGWTQFVEKQFSARLKLG